MGLWGRAVYEFGASSAELASLFLALGLAGLVGATAGGPLVDRFDPRRVLLVGELCAAPAALALILPSSLGGLTALVTVGGFLRGLLGTAEASFAPYLTADPRRLGKVNASLEVAASLALVAGAALAALLARLGGSSGVALVFVLDAVTSLAAVALVVGVRVRGIAVERPALRPDELLAGLRLVVSTPVLAFVVVLAVVRFQTWGMFTVFEPLFFRDALGRGTDVLGAVNAVFGVGLMGGALVAHRWFTGTVTVRTLVLLTLASGVGTIAYTGIANLWTVTAGSLLFGATIGLLVPVERTILQVLTPDRVVGRVMGWCTSPRARATCCRPWPSPRSA